MRILNGTVGELWTPENVRVWGFRSESEIYVEDGGSGGGGSFGGSFGGGSR